MNYDHVPARLGGDGQPLLRPQWPVSRIIAWMLAGAVIGVSILLVVSRGDRAGGSNTADLPAALASAGQCGSDQVGVYGNAAPAVVASPPASTGACHEHGAGPVEADFVNILLVPPGGPGTAPGTNGSAGSFTSECGRNENGHRNSDNFITAPGVVNGAHHVHDYVGNITSNGLSTNDSLAAGGTTCRLGDQSAYFWPVLRRIDTIGTDAGADGGGKDGNVGQVFAPDDVRIEFLGNAQTKVVAMPRFIRVITGDAKAVTNGPANARATWTCVGLSDRVTQQYPICPDGALQRVFDFPSCWDGKNIDSPNHRTHITFPGPDGTCGRATVAVPRLRMTLTYSLPSGRTFAVDSFPEQLHKPITDHADFVNVMPANLMALVVQCVNNGQQC